MSSNVQQQQQQQAVVAPTTMAEIRVLSANYVELYSQAITAHLKFEEACAEVDAKAEADTEATGGYYDDDDEDLNPAILLDLLRPTIKLVDLLALIASALEVQDPPLPLEARVEVYRLSSRGLVEFDRFWSAALGATEDLQLHHHLEVVERARGHGPTNMSDDFKMRATALRAFYRQLEKELEEQG
ncbi:hypothetical protein NpNSSI1_00007490 [Neofusicoccum parvum]|nr:hypothetical protein NpNSSI1_00007490 [Neofusicoccum parvum]